jgi:hypothetical protein
MCGVHVPPLQVKVVSVEAAQVAGMQVVPAG